jgi:hypothetical protein
MARHFAACSLKSLRSGRSIRCAVDAAKSPVPLHRRGGLLATALYHKPRYYLQLCKAKPPAGLANHRAVSPVLMHMLMHRDYPVLIHRDYTETLSRGLCGGLEDV